MRTLTRTLVDDAENKEEPGAVAKPHFLASFDGCSAELEAQLRERFEGPSSPFRVSVCATALLTPQVNPGSLYRCGNST